MIIIEFTKLSAKCYLEQFLRRASDDFVKLFAFFAHNSACADKWLMALHTLFVPFMYFFSMNVHREAAVINNCEL